MTTTDTRALVSDGATDLARLLEGRRSCRGFLPDPVSRETITRVLELARRSPSWCNTQPWHVLVTEGEGTEKFRAALSAHAASAELTPDFPFPAQYVGEYRERRRECGFQLYESVGIAKGDRQASAQQAAKNFELFGAPHAAIITTEADLGVYGAVDCGLYVQTFLLAAQGLGLGAIPQAALAAYAPFIRQHFGLPDNRLIICGVSFGWPDHDHPANGFRTRRAAVEETVTWVG
ncbi:nitroreductase [Nocardia sp. NPDC059246]|uniref:nitroreductase n=1 Tax=unclassified Nocardia TaxID=2637762 RepID=UPI00368E3533